MNLQELLKSFENTKSTSTSFSDVKFFSLKDDGDRATVKILLRSEDDVLNYAKIMHHVEINGFQNKVVCLNGGNDGGECECCNAGIKKQFRILLPLYNTNTNQVELWERGINQIKDLQVMIKKYGDLTKHSFEIIRSGKAKSKDTKYTMMYDPTQIDVDVDTLNIPEVVGRNYKLFLNLTPEQQTEAMLNGTVTWGTKKVEENSESEF